MSAIIDLLGQRFGRLQVTDFAEVRRTGNTVVRQRAFWRCLCACGATIIVMGDSLRNGHTKSCGCLKPELDWVHGEARDETSEYRAWRDMKTRCERPLNTNFPRYGGRGIKVCARWRASYQAFLADMGRKPSPQHSLDRIDNDGHYEPGNVRWATAKQQRSNQRKPRHAAEERQIA